MEEEKSMKSVQEDGSNCNGNSDALRMEEKSTKSVQEDGSDCNGNIDGNLITWSSETNWVISHGFLENSIKIESSDHPINETDPEDQTPKLPLALKPQELDSRPCEIKICFDQKYDISQVYVRSSARVYEIYYAKSPQSSNEYLCTVRCGVAERDEKLLQTASVEDVTRELTEESVTDRESNVSSDDDWVKIKEAPGVGRSFLLDKTNVNRITNVQDLYEATAQISDAEPCSVLTIRFLSLQDKSHLYIDEVYVFVDPVESTDSGTDVPDSSLTQNPLMAMFMPTLLQLSMSGIRQVKDKHSSDERHKDNNTETGLRRINEDNIGLVKSQIDSQNMKLKELDKDKVESDEIQQPKCVESTDVNEMPTGRLERALEQLISRVSRVEDICLRFEEKMLKPIERMEARLELVEHQFETRFQQVEQQLENLTRNFQYSDLPHGTRICAPEFSCSESNFNSFYNERHNCTYFEASEMKRKDLSRYCASDSIQYVPGSPQYAPGSPQYENIRPSLVISAPEFSCGEEEDDNDDLKAPSDSVTTQPKKTLSIDDALVAALSGFMSNLKVSDSKNIQPIPSLSNEADAKNQHVEVSQYCEMKAQAFSGFLSGAKVNNSFNTLPTSGIFSKADEKTRNEKVSQSYEMKTQALSGFLSWAKINNSFSALPTSGLSIKADEKNQHLEVDESLEVKAQELPTVDNCSSKSSRYAQILAVKAPDFTEEDFDDEEIDAACFSKNEEPDICDETVPSSIDIKSSLISADSCDFNGNENHEDNFSSEPDSNFLSGKTQLGDRALNVISSISKSSRASSLNFEFPILEVKFTSDVNISNKNPLEVLLDGETESNADAQDDTCGDDDDKTEKNNAVTRGINGTKNPLLGEHLLVDLGFSTADESSDLEDRLNNMCTPSSSEMIVSLI